MATRTEVIDLYASLVGLTRAPGETSEDLTLRVIGAWDRRATALNPWGGLGEPLGADPGDEWRGYRCSTGH